jgi:KDO2-lipid IV(A) lauroyltransferase
MAVPWHKRLRRRVRSALIRAGLRIISLLPLGIALRLGIIAGKLAYWLAPRQRRLALAHLAIAFPEKSEAERHAIARASFVHLGRAAMELAAVRHLDGRLEEYMALDPGGERLMREAKAQGRGAVFATGHMGNWELLARRLARTGMEPLVIARRSWDERLDDFVASFRASGGVTTLWREDPGAGRQLLKALREGKGLGILIDQDTKAQGVFVPFFGRPAFTPRAAADLALRFRAPLFVGWSRRRGQGLVDGYVLELEAVAYDADAADREAEVLRLTGACTSRIEAVIRPNPAEWVWMHRRWKTLPDSQAREPLANEVPKRRALSSD